MPHTGEPTPPYRRDNDKRREEHVDRLNPYLYGFAAAYLFVLVLVLVRL